MSRNELKAIYNGKQSGYGEKKSNEEKKKKNY